MYRANLKEEVMVVPRQICLGFIEAARAVKFKNKTSPVPRQMLVIF